MDRDELKQDRTIDPRELDMESLRNGDLTSKWAERCVELKAEEEKADYDMEVTEAKLTLRCQDYPQEFGVTKPTVQAIEAGVKLHKDYHAAKMRLIQARKELALHRVALQAMDIRKSTLKDLIELHGRQYFAGPEVPRDLVGAWARANAAGGTVIRQKARMRNGEEE